MQDRCKQHYRWVNQQKRGGNARLKEVHTANKLWATNVVCQTFFKQQSWQRYFEVSASNDCSHSLKRISQKDDFFRSQYEDIRQTEQDGAADANRIYGFDQHHSTVVPWLRKTGIIDHIHGLQKDQVRTAIALLSGTEEPILQSIVDAMQGLVDEALRWCFDEPDCMLSWPCYVVLSRFQESSVEALGRTRAFDPYKQPRTLQNYSTLAKRFLAYVLRVAAGRGYHFDVEGGDERCPPEDVIEMTPVDRDASDASDSSDHSVHGGLEDHLLNFWMLLIAHHTGARRYSSPLLSFCAIFSIKPSTLSWMEPGNFDSHLSALIWIVQLLIFYHSARQERYSGGETLQLVEECCKRYLEQTKETPLGWILRWRLLLFHVSKNTFGGYQAIWDAQEQVLTFEETELRMGQIPTLLRSEYQKCRRLLYQDLMLNLKDYRHMYALTLKDTVDVDTVNSSFVQHCDNASLLAGSDRALLAAVQRSEYLCRLFLVESKQADPSLAWRESAVATYETHVQEFLERLCVLVHIKLESLDRRLPTLRLRDQLQRPRH
ncbi:hypothetical protein LTR85_001795 [Meristemomyces frigidus]|nr:hypothetical protein LTR85_001795 [Meristemomyces frigidus]